MEHYRVMVIVQDFGEPAHDFQERINQVLEQLSITYSTIYPPFQVSSSSDGRNTVCISYSIINPVPPPESSMPVFDPNGTGTPVPVVDNTISYEGKDNTVF